MSKSFLPTTDQPHEELTNGTANDQRKTIDNIPDVPSDEYLEIREPDYLESHQEGIAGNLLFNLTFVL